MQHIYFGNKNAKIVLIQMVDDHDLEVIESEYQHIRELCQEDFLLACCKVNSWNQDLSPWAADPVFGNEPFGDGAEATLDHILHTLIPEITEGAEPLGRTFYIGGYSLAALFALWAACRTDIFSGIAAASPSIWFPGFLDYMQSNEIRAGQVYLSLGDKEERTRNPVMAIVGDCIRKAHDHLLSIPGMRTTLEWNQGNHFKNPDLRTARGFAWVMSGCVNECVKENRPL